jgi:hypothetical protein
MRAVTSFILQFPELMGFAEHLWASRQAVQGIPPAEAGVEVA